MVQKRIISATEAGHYRAEIFQIRDFTFTDTVPPRQYVALGTGVVFDGLAVLMCIEGEYSLRIGSCEYTLKSNQILIVMPYRIITSVQHSENCRVTGFFLGLDYYMRNNLSGPDYNTIIHLKEHPLLTLTLEQMQNLMAFYSVIRVRYNNLNNPYDEKCVRTLIFSFMAELRCIYEKNNSNLPRISQTRQERVTDDFFRLLLDNFKENRSVAFYADKLCFTPKYLSSVIKKVTGHTILEWINEMVVNHTKSLLKTTDKTVLEISEEMNFSNPSFFGRFFKQYTGLTPLQFRYK